MVFIFCRSDGSRVPVGTVQPSLLLPSSSSSSRWFHLQNISSDVLLLSVVGLFAILICMHLTACIRYVSVQCPIVLSMVAVQNSSFRPQFQSRVPHCNFPPICKVSAHYSWCPSRMLGFRKLKHSGNAAKFRVPYARTVAYRHSFFPDVTRMWNALPSDIVTASSLDVFKKEYLCSRPGSEHKHTSVFVYI